MKAIVNTQYGSPDILQFKEVAKPTPKDNEVLIKVHASSINAADLHLLRADPFLVRLEMGLIKPKKRTILGGDVAGQVEAVGKSVTQFQPGDEVFSDLSSCGFGGFAEYVCAPETALVLKPTNITFEQAAAVPLAAITALQGLRDKGQIRAGQKVLINGASGGVGMFAVQIAKSFGADVTAVCSTKKLNMVRSLGANHVIDYTQEDVTRTGQRYDLIFDAAAYRSFLDYKRALTPRGIYVMVGGSNSGLFHSMIVGALVSMIGSQKFGVLMATPNAKDLGFLKDLLESGKVVPVIDKCYPLSETANAFRYVEDRHVQGKVVITVEQDEQPPLHETVVQLASQGD